MIVVFFKELTAGDLFMFGIDADDRGALIDEMGPYIYVGHDIVGQSKNRRYWYLTATGELTWRNWGGYLVTVLGQCSRALG